MRDDDSVHTVHRLEAFSDIVIGFCLAELGVNLLLAKSAGDVVSVWESATFFVAAFIASRCSGGFITGFSVRILC